MTGIEPLTSRKSVSIVSCLPVLSPSLGLESRGGGNRNETSVEVSVWAGSSGIGIAAM